MQRNGRWYQLVLESCLTQEFGIITIETPASTPGPTRGSAYVVEYDPGRGVVRSWYESYDHAGNVNRVSPKMINGKKNRVATLSSYGKRII